MAKMLFNISDKSILLKLHAIALEKAKLDTGYKIVNSGASSNGNSVDAKMTPDQIRAFVDKLSKKDSGSTKCFSSKNGLYEVGVVVDENVMKTARHGGMLFEGDGLKTPVDAYNALKADGKTDKTKLDKIQEKAYGFLVSYIAAFCGEKYAKSIPEDKVICEAYQSEDFVEKVKDGMLGDQKTSSKITVKALLYKIGYSVGAKKA